MALTQEQIHQMIAGLQGTSPEQLSQMGGMYRDPTTGQGIHANYGAGGYNPATGDYSAGAPTEYMVSAPGATRAASSPFDRYSTAGQYTGTGNYAPATNIEKQLLKYGLALAGTAAAGGAFGNMFGSGAGGASAAGDAFMPGALGVDGAAMSTAPLSGLESYVAGGATGAGGASVAGDMFMPGQLGANYTPGVIPGLESYVTGSTGGLLGGLGKALGGSKGLGALATAAGGLLGSKPQETSQTSTRSIDPRFENAIFGQGGLLGMVQGNLANRATSGVGQRLMNIPVRGNPFSRG